MDTIAASLTSYAPLLILILGWLLDLIFGDPARLPHPVVYMGKWISFWEHRLNKGRHRMLKGAVFSVLSILLTFVVIYLLWLLCSCPRALSWTGMPSIVQPSVTVVIFAILAFYCLAGHTLRKEVRLVFEAVDRSLDDGRRQVARIVGRDTMQLSAQEVRTAALETLAENLSDGVIAPLFWFVLLGVPGMMAYKMVNTLDSMIGYQNPRYKDFGCWAARIDDVANYIPARITAVVMLIAAAVLRMSLKNIPAWLSFLRRFASKHASPNSGWPEAALAGVLDCQFGGTHNYFGASFYKPHIGTNPRLLTTSDMRVSLRVCFVAELLCVLCLCVILSLA